MSSGFKGLISRSVIALSPAAIAVAAVAGSALAKPAPHAGKAHLLPGGTVPVGWMLPVAIAALVIAALLAVSNWSDPRAAVAARRRRSAALDASEMAGMSSESGRSISQAAR